MTEGQLDFTQKRRFYQNEIADKKYILIALHGYGQLGRYFYRKNKTLKKTPDISDN